ncbi:CAP domain-containing protein [Ideonella sp.]|uniref:CAP domain-containing protein n=1 Tax=Ideonella sp. TaxID=1929293 RepID=UPI0035AFC8F7
MALSGGMALPLVACQAGAAPRAGPAAAVPALAGSEAAVRARANAFRAESGLAPLAPERALQEAARAFAAYMAESDHYGHEADGRTPAQRSEAAGYRWCAVAENIAYVMRSDGFATEELARRLMDGWIASPGHRRNLQDGDMTQTGVAIAHSTRTGRYYAVQLFGRPRDARVRFDIRNSGRQPTRYTLGEQAFDLPPGTTRTHEQCRAEPLRLPGRGAAVAPRDGAHYRLEPAGAGDWRLVEG